MLVAVKYFNTSKMGSFVLHYMHTLLFLSQWRRQMKNKYALVCTNHFFVRIWYALENKSINRETKGKPG